MSIEFTPEEKEIIVAYASMQVGLLPSLKSLATDFVPAFLAFGYGMYSGKEIYMVLGMFFLVYAAGYKKFKEHRYAVLLKSISSKLIEVRKPDHTA